MTRIEPLPLPLPIPLVEVESMLAGTHPDDERDAAGRYVRGVHAGLTPADVDAERREAESDRGFGRRLLQRLREAGPPLPEPTAEERAARDADVAAKIEADIAETDRRRG